MTALAYYLLKMVLCSGLLFLYYHAALKNRLFHQWNRYYLLCAVALSLVLPLLQFNLFSPDGDGIVYAVESADSYLQAITLKATAPSVTPEQWILLGYGLVCLAFLGSFVLALVRIRRILRRHQVQEVEDIRFVNTAEEGTPFSFLRYIFWNEAIALDSETGQRIFEHELVHVREKHTWDKLLLQALLVLFWCNPFFWLIRRELRFVHEFIADKKAVGQHGAEALSAMLLHAAYPQHFNRLTNAFFQTSLKRRFQMLNKTSNPRLAYFSRVIALPLVALVAFAFTVRSREAATAAPLPSTIFAPLTDTLPKNNKAIESVDVNKKRGLLTITYTDGTCETLTENEAMERGLINNTLVRGKVKIISGKPARTNEIRIRPASDTGAHPLVMVNGKEIDYELMQALDPNKILAIDVLKDASATKLFGDRGKNGVLLITTKNGEGNPAELRADTVRVEGPLTKTSGNVGREITVTGHPLRSSEPVFEKAEQNASIDPQQWRMFLESNARPIIEQMAANRAPAGSYTAYVQFLIEKDGSLSQIRLVKGIGYGADENLLQMMKSSPRWTPAQQNGRVVRSIHTQPITMVISGEGTNPSKTATTRS